MQYQRPVLVQQQKLKMSPQLYQSIQMMALPIQELRQKIREELERNPALEIVSEKQALSIDENRPNTEDFDAFENSSDPGYNQSRDREAGDRKQKFLEGALSRSESLHDHLLWQWQLQPIDRDLYETGELLIQNLDHNGFHIEEPSTFLSPRQMERFQEAAERIRQLEPAGTCTANFKESLIVQARLSPAAPDRIEEVIEKHMELLERGRYQDVARKMHIDLEDVDEILEFLRTLNPFPGRLYSSDEVRFVVPDVMVVMLDGEYQPILNDEEVPVLGINDFYTQLLRENKARDQKEVRSFVRDHVKDAQWFIRSVTQRNQTLLRISKAVVEFQRDFFRRGPKYLKPLTLKDIAQAVDVHETTVSRIANSKYIQTEWGIFELKYFFTNSISGAGSTGSQFSKEGVKHRIREIIEEHSSSKRLSDQKIADILAERGIKIARRTVAKYRQELDILSSYDR
ncbi:RNA polymerase factor sigma-54 [Marispirochaeta aestuarii]|uniref:RNA polymerase factor sigma-54 n=1 Tax=Marispirochaeta aestuarii TaxID=1963862 RepID=UPI0029C7F1E4|nr:RNA polymerase factor sigma-54 [Marispirochaeta aestuarii]